MSLEAPAEPGLCTRPERGHSGPCNGYPAATCWRHISTCPAGVMVLTKIEDEAQGARNIDTPMVRSAETGLFAAPGGAPILYAPTQWRWAYGQAASPMEAWEQFAASKTVTVDAALAAVASALNDCGGLWSMSRNVFLADLRKRLERL